MNKLTDVASIYISIIAVGSPAGGTDSYRAKRDKG